MNSIRKIIKTLGEKNKDGAIPFRGKSIFVMIGVTVMFSGAFLAQSAWGLDPAQREVFITSLPRGETFENDGSTYAWLPTLRAERTDQGKAESNLNENDGSSPVEAAREGFVERKGPFTVYRRSFAQEPSIGPAETSGGVTAYPVVFNLKTKSFAVITGNIFLKLKDMEDAKAIADAYGIPLSFTNTHMSTAFYGIPAEVDIFSLREDLENDSRVSRVTLDMVERIRHPH